jgi:endonuclease/exonuclease/phosphatase (EEP) superfamily protein YafD
VSAADPFDPRRDRAERLKQLVRRLGWMLTAPLLLVHAGELAAPSGRRSHRLQVWNEMMAQVLDLARESSGPLLVGGDLNTTPHQAWFRRLLASGMRGAHEDAGRALATTWPNGRLMVPPIRLDHLLVSEELRVLSVREGEGRGSDHQPVIADLQLVTPPSDDANPRP